MRGLFSRHVAMPRPIKPRVAGYSRWIKAAKEEETAGVTGSEFGESWRTKIMVLTLLPITPDKLFIEGELTCPLCPPNIALFHYK